MINVWIVIGPSMHNAYETRKEKEEAGLPYNGPMDDETYRILSTYPDPDSTRGLFQGKNVNGAQPFVFYSLYFASEWDAVIATAHLANNWPGKQFESQGGWVVETGEPSSKWFPLIDTAYQVIPGATSNEDLVDTNLVGGQKPRIFT